MKMEELNIEELVGVRVVHCWWLKQIARIEGNWCSLKSQKTTKISLVEKFKSIKNIISHEENQTI